MLCELICIQERRDLQVKCDSERGIFEKLFMGIFLCFRMQYILENDLGLKPLKFQKVQELIDGLKMVRLEKAKELLRLHESGLLPNLVFFHAKLF